LVKKAWFYSGLSKIKTFDKETAQTPFRPQHIFYFMQSFEFKPSFIVDVTEYFEMKKRAVNAFGTQFFDPSSKEPETFISQPGFLTMLEARAQFYGFKIRKKYAEPFFCEEYPDFDINRYTESLPRERAV
jgi:LmbE family N-acetylglucosaminyl deacetylase